MAGQSGIKTTSGNHFEATYEAPWGGISSDLYPTDIAPNQFVSSVGMAIRSGNLCSEYYSTNNSSINWTLPANTAVLAVVTINGTLCVFDQLGNVYVNNTGVGGFTLDQVLGASVNINCIKIINGVAYIFDFNAGASYAYTPGVSYIINSSYVGGKVCGVVDGYLITANSNQPTDSPAIKSARINWSSPYQFGVWDPAASRQAGYNVLADVEDEITGFVSIANVAFAIRTNGITQLTPTGIGIQPFDFPTLSSGDFGIGCSFPDTLAVYGNIAAFGDNTDFYFFQGSTPTPITGTARDAIFADINNLYNRYKTGVVNSTVSAAFANSSYNNTTPELTYTIAITQISTNIVGTPPNAEVIFWTYSVKSKTWMRNTFDIGGYISANYSTEGSQPRIGTIYTSKIQHVKYPINSNANGKRPAFVFPIYIFSANITAGTNPGVINIVLNQFQNKIGTGYLSSGDNLSFDLMFKQEEIKMRRQPTISLIVVRASGYGTLNLNINGRPFTPIVLSAVPSLPAVWQTFTSSGVYTGEAPQLEIDSTLFYGTINKVMLVGTYADGDLG